MRFLSQVAALVATFANASWQKRLPHDETGQAARIWRFVRRWMLVCEWTASTILALQVRRKGSMSAPTPQNVPRPSRILPKEAVPTHQNALV